MSYSSIYHLVMASFAELLQLGTFLLCLHQSSVTQFHTVQHTHTRPFNGPFIGATQVSRYLKGKTNLDFTEVRDSEWQWHQLGHMQVCISLQTDNHASTPPLSFFTGLMPFLPPTQQCQSTEGSFIQYKFNNNLS